MLLKAKEIKNLLISKAETEDDPFVIVPTPVMPDEGSASVDIRLGTWFASFRGEKNSILNVYDKKELISEKKLIKYHYIPFGGEYVLHPNSFLLGITLEWIRFPKIYGGYVVGKSSWGRRGLIIATAAGIHPGFTGCLTLELCNSGEIPIMLKPGLTICQLFIHKTASEKSDQLDKTQFIGKRKPTLGKISPDEIAEKLAQNS